MTDRRTARGPGIKLLVNLDFLQPTFFDTIQEFID